MNIKALLEHPFWQTLPAAVGPRCAVFGLTFLLAACSGSSTTEQSSSATISVNLLVSNSVIVEHAEVGALVGRLSVNSNGTLTPPLQYKLIDSSGGRFKIVGDQLQVAEPDLVDYEAQSLTRVLISATDSNKN